MISKKIEILKHETIANFYTVIIDDKFAAGLCVDEALGCVASALMDRPQGLLYVKTYEQWHKWQKAVGGTYAIVDPIALLEDKQCL